MENTEQKQVYFYNANGVSVTQSIFVANGTTYAMRNITSVSLYEIEKDFETSAFITLAGLVFLIFHSTRTLGIICIAGSLLVAFAAQQNYSVRITSNDGELDGFVSTDRDEVRKIIDAVNSAMIYHV